MKKFLSSVVVSLSLVAVPVVAALAAQLAPAVGVAALAAATNAARSIYAAATQE